MNARPKVSVIVPVYNTRNVLGQCLDSLMAQTYANVEFVFVDDASTDGSAELLAQCASQHPEREINIIHLPQNRGRAYARNCGMDHATGDFLAFCDSDDWVEPTMIEACVNCALEQEADIVVFPFFRNEDEVIPFPDVASVGDVNLMPLDTLHYSLWNKLFRASLIRDNGFRAIEGVHYWEDLIVTAKAFVYARKTAALPYPLYHYRHPARLRLSQEQWQTVLDDQLLTADSLAEWFAAQGPDFAARYAPFLRYLRFVAKAKFLRLKPHQWHRWKTTYPCTTADILRLRHVPLPYRLTFALLNLLPL
ncbi:MAG: glycosyltransferase family 2 protein [Muribaculaceae bacterium]|nr:glycosyltransferase family 2 protein [Muribaculaceae bacterium]